MIVDAINKFQVWVGFQTMISWLIAVKKKDKVHAHIFGGGRVSDGTMSPFHSRKKTTN